MRYLSALFALAALLAFAVACGDDEETATPTTPAATTAAPTTPAVTTPAVTTTPTASPAVCALNPDPAPTDIVQVDQPSPGDSVTRPLQVTGRISAFEATFAITIVDADGNVIADQTAMSAEGQTLAPFSAIVPFSVSEATPACVWVYEKSARDGSAIHVVQVPVTLLP